MADKLISADALRQRMYHDAFETDTEMQRWDGGCWIRYKMFENALEDAPTIDAVPVVRCKDCKWYECAQLKRDGTVDKRYKASVCVRGAHAKPRKADWFCADGERGEDAEE